MSRTGRKSTREICRFPLLCTTGWTSWQQQVAGTHLWLLQALPCTVHRLTRISRNVQSSSEWITAVTSNARCFDFYAGAQKHFSASRLSVSQAQHGLNIAEFVFMSDDKVSQAVVRYWVWNFGGAQEIDTPANRNGFLDATWWWEGF